MVDHFCWVNNETLPMCLRPDGNTWKSFLILNILLKYFICFRYETSWLGQSQLAPYTSCNTGAYPQQGYPSPAAFSTCSVRQDPATRYPSYWHPDGDYSPGPHGSPPTDPQLLMQWGLWLKEEMWFKSGERTGGVVKRKLWDNRDFVL